MKTSSCKNKARRLQQHISMRIKEYFNLGEGDCESVSMGKFGVDITLSSEGRYRFPISVEAKNTKSKPGLEALRQSSCNKYEGTKPVVVWHPPRASYDDSIVFINLLDFLDVMFENWKLREENIYLSGKGMEGEHD